MTSMSPLKWQALLVVASVALALILAASGVIDPTIDSRSIFIFVSVFFGSVVVGAAGFGSAVVAGAIMLFWIAPVSAVPILNSASFTTQLISMAQLWKILRWRSGFPLIVGGLIGIPAGVFLLQNTAPDTFRLVFGTFLACWSVYLLVRPKLRFRKRGPLSEIAVGWTGGLTAGAIAFPGALPAIWCTLTRDTKEEQRGTIQLFIVVIQLWTLAYLFAKGLVGHEFISDFVKMLPVIMIGTFVGVQLFSKIDEALFRRLVLMLLVAAGTIHAINASMHLLHHVP